MWSVVLFQNACRKMVWFDGLIIIARWLHSSWCNIRGMLQVGWCDSTHLSFGCAICPVCQRREEEEEGEVEGGRKRGRKRRKRRRREEKEEEEEGGREEEGGGVSKSLGDTGW